MNFGFFWVNLHIGRDGVTADGFLMTDRGRGRERCVHLFLMKCVRSDAKRTLIYSIYSIL